MEIALNLIWLGVTSFFLLGILYAKRRGQLRLSLGLTVSCVALLALVLFPAISMTDDLAQFAFYGEDPGDVPAGRMLQALDDGLYLTLCVGLFACTLFCALLQLRGLSGNLLPAASRGVRCRCDGFLRLCAMRPPPSLAF